MIRTALCLPLAAGLVALATGCGIQDSHSPVPNGGNRPAASPNPVALVEGKKFVLATEPAGAKSIIDIRKVARDGDEVIIAGQVGGSTKPFTEGRAAFLLVDTTLKPTAECESPWDFCEYPKTEVAAARVTVKLVDAEGKTLTTGARELFGIKELSTVVVKGKVSRDDSDNVIVVASGVYVRPEKK